MSQFQLDVTDCDDILNFVKRLRIPSYLFHVQVREDYQAPTSRKVGVNAWWISVADMRKAFIRTKNRQTEQRPAAYFKRSAFKSLADFPEHLNSQAFKSLGKRVKQHVPTIYRITR
jgi:hypothetical protein